MTTAAIDFRELARRQLGPLLSPLGFACSESGAGLVRWQSSRARVDAAYDGLRSYELELRIGPRNRAEPPEVMYTLAQVLRAKADTESERFALVQVQTEKDVAAWLDRMGQALLRAAPDLLAGQQSGFDMLERWCENESRDYMGRLNLETARKDAAKAWAAKDYRAFISRLSPLKDQLTESERKKLEWAANRLAHKPSE